MQLDRTKSLIHDGINLKNPLEALAHVLESALELISLPDNDFAWSSWDNAAEAQAEVSSLIQCVQSGALPERASVSVLFAPTGPLQEVSLGSGWAEPFLKVAERFDEVEAFLWLKSG
ncbi:hypothetical protein [Jeongeupia naejangsanensis]|uniref:Uncharacterized protein n=1 Tax=Jeongeupia naejangsanensis TaxID=613195 RepID=A0ABS2BLW2_9NEIS|nr:hypothetical protein [Jeongeupia naejangsanensis]MBM3116078.1 hypothetical protein [Jeongeupia naejangsanensis]